jgi:vancomycin resistance protein YoaR
MEAPAIRYGELIDELGGGICQLSGTLYNAALASDLEIVERHHHTWPSDYLPIGQDATITWPNKDLKIRNNTEWPIYIHAIMVEEELRVTIYGQKHRPGLTIQVENNVYETINPPAPELIADPNRPVGYRQELTKPRKGYSVRVYKRYYDGETLVDEELVHTDRFVAIRGKYVEGTYVPPVLDFGEPNDIK